MIFRCFKVYIIVVLFALGIVAGTAHARPVVYLSSLEWPPYVGKYLPENGSSAKIVREAFAAMGFELRILFLPWKRAMHMADNDFQVVGYFPEYYSPERAGKYVFSKSYSCSPVSLLESKNPVVWNTVDDLAGLRVGFVSGYVNTTALDRAVSNGTIVPDYAPTDKNNIMKVIKGRVDCAVVDPLVYGYLAVTDEDISRHSGALQIEPRAFGVNELFVAFQNDDAGRFYARILNEGLKKIGQTGSCDNE